jgi:hypothetical protein
MIRKSTDHLIADVLAIGMEIRLHVEDRRRKLTSTQMEGLSNAITAIQNYFFSWKAHELARRDVTLLPTTAKSTARKSVTGQTVTVPRKRCRVTG